MTSRTEQFNENFRTENDALDFWSTLKESITFLKENTTFGPEAGKDPAWGPVFERMGRGREGTHGWNSRLWNGWDRSVLVDAMEEQGFEIIHDGRITRITTK